MKVKIHEMAESKTFDDYPEDTLFVHEEHFARFILEPFEVVLSDDPRYDSALTREQLVEMRNKL